MANHWPSGTTSTCMSHSESMQHHDCPTGCMCANCTTHHTGCACLQPHFASLYSVLTWLATIFLQSNSEELNITLAWDQVALFTVALIVHSNQCFVALYSNFNFTQCHLGAQQHSRRVLHCVVALPVAYCHYSINTFTGSFTAAFTHPWCGICTQHGKTYKFVYRKICQYKVFLFGT